MVSPDSIFDLFPAAIGKAIGLTIRNVLGAVVVHGRPLLSKIGSLSTAYNSLLRSGSWVDAERFVTAFYGKTHDFLTRVTPEVPRVIESMGRRVADIEVRWLWRTTAVEVKNWTTGMFRLVEHNADKWDEIAGQLRKDAFSLSKNNISRVDWHFTKDEVPQWFIEKAQEIFWRQKVQLHIYDWTK